MVEKSITMNVKQYNDLKSLLLDIKEDMQVLKSEKQKEILSPKEVQKMLGIGRSTYKRYVEEKIITQSKLKGKAHVQRSEIDRLLKEGKV